MLEELKMAVWKANMELPKRGLVIYTWGNVSGIDRDKGLVVIKPSGVPYEELRVEDMVVLDLAGNKVEGDLNPSSDTDTHLTLYKAFSEVGGIVHTHSTWATVWCQSGMSLPPLGGTHGDYFFGDIPCTRGMTAEEINESYEAQTGNVIIETFSGKDPLEVPAVLVRSHAPFSWGKDPAEAVHNAVVIEEVAKLAYHTLALNPTAAMDKAILDKHFWRKHGSGAYYGQK